MEQSEEPLAESPIEDRVASLFDETIDEDAPLSEEDEPEAVAAAADDDAEETSDEAAEADGDASETVEVEIGGLKFEVGVTEAEALKQATMLQSDYTQKTQSLAQERRALELQVEEVKQLAAEREFLNLVTEEQNQLATLDFQMNQLSQIDWQTMSGEEMLRAQATQKQLETARSQVVASLQQKQQGWVEQRNRNVQAYLQKGREWLSKSLNGWDQDKAAEVTNYMLSSGVPEPEVKSLTNPLYVAAFYKAMKFDQAMQGKHSAVQKIKAAPTIKPKGQKTPMPKDVRAKLDFRNKANRKNLSSKEFESLVEDRMASIFDR